MYGRTRHEGLGGEVARRILMGTYALSAGYYDAYYKRAQQVSRWRDGLAAGAPQGAVFGCLAISAQQTPAAAPPHPSGPQVRTLVQREMSGALQQYDALLCPAAPTPAYRLGEKASDPLAMYKGAPGCPPPGCLPAFQLRCVQRFVSHAPAALCHSFLMSPQAT